MTEVTVDLQNTVGQQCPVTHKDMGPWEPSAPYASDRPKQDLVQGKRAHCCTVTELGAE